jgi:hypothetical protein
MGCVIIAIDRIARFIRIYVHTMFAIASRRRKSNQSDNERRTNHIFRSLFAKKHVSILGDAIESRVFHQS